MSSPGGAWLSAGPTEGSHNTLAIAAIAMTLAPMASMALAQAAEVAPVVMTSSTRMTLALARAWDVAVKAPATWAAR